MKTVIKKHALVSVTKIKLLDDSAPHGNSSWTVGHAGEEFLVEKYTPNKYIVADGPHKGGLIQAHKCQILEYTECLHCVQGHY